MTPERGRKLADDSGPCGLGGLISERDPRKGTETKLPIDAIDLQAISERDPRKGTETGHGEASMGGGHRPSMLADALFQNVTPERGRKLVRSLGLTNSFKIFQNVTPERGRKLHEL